MNTDSGRRNAVWFWLALWAIVPAIVVIQYGVDAFTDVPHIDDWSYIDRLRALENGEIGFAHHLFERHNGHPSLFSRLAMWVSYRFFELDMCPIRWLMLVVQFASAALAARLVIGENWRAVRETHALLLGAPAVVMTALSLNEWETYSIAVNTAFVFATFFTLAAVLAFQKWLSNDGSLLALAASLACAALASLSGSQGVLALGALAVMALLQPRWARWRLGAALAAALVVGVALNALANEGGATTPLEFGALSRIALMLAGVPWFTAVNNTPAPGVFVAFGAFAALAAAAGGFWWLRAAQEERARALPSLALLVFGLGVIALLTVGRRDFPLEAIAASRYANLLFPGAVGLVGLLSVAASSSAVGRAGAAGLFAVSMVGWFAAVEQESLVKPYRVEAMHNIRALARSEAMGDVETVQRTFFVDAHYASELAPRAVAFMRERRIGVFRNDGGEPQPEAPPSR